jgi:hypothetical protein
VTELGDSAALAPTDGAAPSTPTSEPVENRWYPNADQAPAADATKDTEGAAATAGVPERYEFALEGLEIDPAMVTAAEPVLRELGLTNESANKLLPVATKLISNAQDRTMQAMIDAGAKQRKDWLAEYHADPVIGGAKRAETQRLAEAGMTAAGFKHGHPFRQMLTESGLGNHPDMIRTFRRLGELVGSGGGSQAPALPESRDARWYGKES